MCLFSLYKKLDSLHKSTPSLFAMRIIFVSTMVVFILVHSGLQASVESLGKAAAHIGDPTAWKSAAAEGLGQSLDCVWDLFGVTKRGCPSWHLCPGPVIFNMQYGLTHRLNSC